MDFWSWVAWFFWVFVFVAYLMVLFSIITDIFRDSALNGWAKAAWVLFLVFVPILTALVYLIARGSGMQRRTLQRAAEMRADQDDYIRATAGTPASAADEISKAKRLMDSGAITEAEFATIKANALGSERMASGTAR